MAATEQGGSTAVPGEPRPRWTETAEALASSLWFPALFFFGFLFCYLLAFHDPTRHNIRVAARAPAAAQLRPTSTASTGSPACPRGIST